MFHRLLDQRVDEAVRASAELQPADALPRPRAPRRRAGLRSAPGRRAAPTSLGPSRRAWGTPSDALLGPRARRRPADATFVWRRPAPSDAREQSGWRAAPSAARLPRRRSSALPAPTAPVDGRWRDACPSSGVRRARSAAASSLPGWARSWPSASADGRSAVGPDASRGATAAAGAPLRRSNLASCEAT